MISKIGEMGIFQPKISILKTCLQIYLLVFSEILAGGNYFVFLRKSHIMLKNG